MQIGEVIKQARKRNAISQRILALRAGTDQAAIRRVERGEVSPSIETVQRLLAAMGERLPLKPIPLERNYDPAPHAGNPPAKPSPGGRREAILFVDVHHLLIRMP